MQPGFRVLNGYEKIALFQDTRKPFGELIAYNNKKEVNCENLCCGVDSWIDP
jgi:hypothetical protein